MADTTAFEVEMFSNLGGDDDIWSCFNSIQLEKDILFDYKEELDPLADIEIDINQADIDVLFWNGSLLETVESELRDDVMWGSPNGSNLAVSPRTLSPVDPLAKPQIKEEPQDYVEFEVKEEVKEEPQEYEYEDHPPLEDEEPKRPSFGKQAHQQQQPRCQRQQLEKSVRGASTSRNKTVVVQKTRSLLRKIKKEPEEVVEEENEGRVKQKVVPDSEHYAASEAFSRQVASFQQTNPYLTAARFDHNYDMKKRIKTDDLGVQTPSDTEKEDDEGYTDEDEEIDVVNTPPYSEWTPSSSPSPHSRGVGYTAPSSIEQKKRIKTILPKRSLPNNPSRQRRYELELSVAHSFGSNNQSTTKEVLSTSTAAVKRKIDQYEEEEEEEEDKDEEEDYDLDDDDEEEEDSDYETGYSSEQGTRSANTKRGKRLKMSPSWNSEEEKRAYHNQMERKRRQDLKSNLERLKCLIPDLKSDPRASKQNILNQAVPIVLREERVDRECTKTKELLRQKQAVLKHKVRRLRKVLRHLRERKFSLVTELIN